MIRRHSLAATVTSFAVALTLATGACAQARHDIQAPPTPLTTDPQGIAAAGLLTMAFNEGKVQEAFDKYVGATYSQSGGPDAKAQTIAFLSNALKNNPDWRYDIKRVVVGGDVAAVYAHVYRNKQDVGSKVVDFFRFENGKIVEHLDVIQSLAPRTPSPGAPPVGPAR